MYPASAAIFLSLVLTLFSASVSTADIWLCPQPDGSLLYTDEPQGAGSCEKFVPVSQLIYVPQRSLDSAPPAAATYEKRAVDEPEAPPENGPEGPEAPLPDAGDGSNAPQSSLGGYDGSPAFPGVYNYVVTGFVGIPFPRRHARGFSNQPRTQHEGQRLAHVREKAVRAVAPAAPPHSVAPTPSTHSRENSSGAVGKGITGSVTHFR
jgi:hypothetical protein